ncbi:ATPase domain-containing protein [Dictyobacter arantiisoli]|uniref:Circadian clock protein KaiC n=1 Tax=Dictyobacter arantiisoli TaxID=2014874 RepID=A0A5A5TCP6_9CHLR|nr:ATPase domain-containing protein [Dictyobacter arantiisoli]GCF08926.1 circadian clock protein KaiC [Dictyobacter arantiisoli]
MDNSQKAIPDLESLPLVQLEPTGVPQLDLVLGGGIPQGALSIILGPPGSGKTTLASQIAFASAQRGQRVIILTALSEPTTKLLSHLSAYHFYAASLIGTSVQIFSLQQFLPQGLAATSQEIVAAVRQTKANLVVLDGFQSIRSLEPNLDATRRLLYDLGLRLSLHGTTTLITTESDPHDPALFPEMTTGDVLIGLYFKIVGVRTFRNLEVIKVRGRAPLSGLHSLTLSDSGVTVFPRLESRVKQEEPTNLTAPVSRIQFSGRADFGLSELDTLLGGGLTRGTSTLLTGSLGMGKTLLALQFALNGVHNSEPTLFLSFRETSRQLIQKADDFALGEQLRAALAPDGGLTLQRWEPVELDPDQIALRLITALEQTHAQRVVVDSIAEIERAVEESNGKERTSNYLSALLSVLRERSVTLLAIKETPRNVTTQFDFSSDALAVLAENLIFLQQIAYRGKLHRVLSVLKMRFSSHDYMLREFQIKPPEGLRVLTHDESGLEVILGLIEQQGAELLPHTLKKKSTER